MRAKGTGAVIGEGGTKPAVGEAERLEAGDEVRLEELVPITKGDRVIAAMRAAVGGGRGGRAGTGGGPGGGPRTGVS